MAGETPGGETPTEGDWGNYDGETVVFPAEAEAYAFAARMGECRRARTARSGAHPQRWCSGITLTPASTPAERKVQALRHGTAAPSRRSRREPSDGVAFRRLLKQLAHANRAVDAGAAGVADTVLALEAPAAAQQALAEAQLAEAQVASGGGAADPGLARPLARDGLALLHTAGPTPDDGGGLFTPLVPALVEQAPPSAPPAPAAAGAASEELMGGRLPAVAPAAPPGGAPFKPEPPSPTSSRSSDAGSDGGWG